MTASREERRRALLEKFRALAQERLERLSAGWLALERNPGDAEAAAELKREIHTLKGESRAVGLPEASALAHRTEDVLGLAASAGWRVAPEVFSAVLGAFDTLGRMVQGSGDIDLQGTLGRLDAALGRLSTAPTAEAPAARAADPGAPAQAATTEAARALRGETLRVPMSRLATLSDGVAQLLVLSRALRREVEAAAADASKDRRAWELLRGRLARLGEVEHQLDLVGRDIDGSVRALRLVPLSTLFSGLQRQVRDLSLALEKSVALELSGDDVEADKRVLEQLEEPLLHLLRNALDHGIEAPKHREAAGKPGQGTVRVSAVARGSELVLVVADDGAGLDTGALRQAAVTKGLLTAEAAARLDDAQAQQLIFLSGFSTRAGASDVSGRGIGMDVVRARVEQLGGRLVLASERGKGVHVTVTVPLSITLTSCLVVELAGHRYALPTVAIDAVATLEPEAVQQTPRGEVLKVGDDFLPLVELSSLLAVPSPPGQGDRVLLLRSGPERFAAKSPDSGREAELLVRPAGPPLRGHKLVTGLAAMDDGAPVLVLGVAALLERTRAGLAARHPAREGAPARGKKAVLVVEDSPIFQELVTAILAGLGLEVRVAPDGAAAVDALGQSPVDLVLSDIQMPRMNGLELVRWLRAQPRLRHLPVVLMSQLGSAEDQRRGLEAGADAYLVKSALSERTLVSTLERFLA